MKTLGQLFAHELSMETKASRACLEQMRADLFEYKPHEKSMQMGYLALMVADIPLWVTTIIKTGEIDFGTWEHHNPKTAEEYLALFDKNMQEAIATLEAAPDEEFDNMFTLKNQGQELSKDSKLDSVSSSINHLVHHRGQLTVYMKLNNMPIPSIYGPSADENTFA